MKALPIIQPPSPDAPSVAAASEPINREVTMQVLDLVEELAQQHSWVPIASIFEQLARRKHKQGASRPTLLWSLWHLWNEGVIVFKEADAAALEAMDPPKGKVAETAGDKTGPVQQVRLGYVKIASHGKTNLSGGSRADKYRYGPVPDKPAKSGLSLPEKDWGGHPLDWMAKGAPLTVAYGAGVDSTAVLVEFVRRRYPIELILFADVGNEKPETYQYLKVMDKFLRDNGYPTVTVVQYEMTAQGIARRVTRAEQARKLLAKGVRYWPKGLGEGDDVAKEIRPVDPRGYTTLGQNCVYNLTYPSLAFGFQDHNCSAKWKVKPQVDYIESSREFGPKAHAAWAAGLPVIRTIGFDASAGDRGRRNRIPDDIHHMHWYPLQDWGWDRERAKAEIRKAGLPVPLKSSCVFCPSTQPEEVEWLVRSHPEIIDEIRLIEDTARPYNDSGPQQGLWYLGSVMPAADQQRFGHRYWFGSGSTPAAELARFVELHYLRGRQVAVPSDPDTQVESVRRVVAAAAPGVSVTQIQRKESGERVRGWVQVRSKKGESFSADQLKALAAIGIEPSKSADRVTLSPDEVFSLLSVWFQQEALREIAAPPPPTPGRISDFVQAYLYLCKHHPDHPRCMGWQPGKPPPKVRPSKRVTEAAESYDLPNPVFPQYELPAWQLDRRGRPTIYFEGNEVGGWRASSRPVNLSKAGWQMMPDSDPKSGSFWSNGMTEYHPGFRASLREMVAVYPDLLEMTVKFDGPPVSIAKLVAEPSAPLDWTRVRFYHGTSEQAWQQIRRGGLMPRAQTGSAAAYGKKSSAKEGSPNLVYLTTQLQTAHYAASDAAGTPGNRPVIIEIMGVPNPSRLRADEDSEFPSIEWASLIADAAVAGMDPDDDDTYYARQKAFNDAREPSAEWSLAKLGSVAYEGRIDPARMRVIEACCDENLAWYPFEEHGDGYKPNPTAPEPSRVLDDSFDWVNPAVQAEIPDAVARALRSGAVAPLSYAGAGAYGIVLCDQSGKAFKVARHWPQEKLTASSLREEAEWFRFAGSLADVRQHVAQVYGFDETNAVLVRECVAARQHQRKNTERLWKTWSRIADAMRPYGWRGPEFKEDSFVYHPRRGPVLVDAGLGPRDLGWSNARRARELLRGAAPRDAYEASSVAHGLRMDAGHGIPEAIAERLASQLDAIGSKQRPNPASLEDYAGQHRAPDEGSGAPIWDLTGNDIYPKDVYERWHEYQSHETGEQEGWSVALSVKHHPWKPVRIYRAVPGEPPIKQQIDKLLATLHRGKLPKELRGYVDEDKYWDEMRAKLLELQRQKPTKAPRIQINPGDWVTTSRRYAIEHGRSNLAGKYKVLSKTVPAYTLFTEGNSIVEWGYIPNAKAPSLKAWADVTLARRLIHGKVTRDAEEIAQTAQRLRTQDIAEGVPPELAHQLADGLDALSPGRLKANPTGCWHPGASYETVYQDKRSEASVIRDCLPIPHGRLVHAGVIRVPFHSGVQMTLLSDLTGVPARADRRSVDEAVRDLQKKAPIAPVRIAITVGGHVVVDSGAHVLVAARQMGVKGIKVDWLLGADGMSLSQKAAVAIAALVLFTPIEEIATAGLVAALA